MTCLVANMRVFFAVVNIFRMLTAMFSSVQFSVRGYYLMAVAFCCIIFFASFDQDILTVMGIGFIR